MEFDTQKISSSDARLRNLQKEDYMLYGRQMLLSEIGPEKQLRLANARVMVIGAGGLGCPVLQYLNGTGVGHLSCADFDHIEMHNLHRQLLYAPHQVGRAKVVVAKEVLSRQRPGVHLAFVEEKLTPDNAARLLCGHDLVIDGSDNFKTRYLINDTCQALGIPVIYGSISGFEGQLAVFGHKGSKRLRALFPSPPQQGVPNCAENGVLGTLPGIIGLMMAHEALKLIMELPVLHNELVIFDTLTMRWRKLSF